MHAVIAAGGKQHLVSPGQVVRVERLPQVKGDVVEFDKVLLIVKDGQVTMESGALARARVKGQVVSQQKARKVAIVKFKRRKNYRRHGGHRQLVTLVRITGIEG